VGRGLSPVSLVLVTHNSEAHIEASLGILLSDPAGPEEIIGVDNASTDGTIRIVERMGVKLVALDENHGFAYGCNLGASLTRGEVVAFLNPDTEPTPGWLPPLLEAIERPGIGAAMPVMDLTYQPDHWFTSRSALTYLGFAWSTHTGERIPADLGEYEVPFPSGAAFVMKRELFDYLGGFRDEYFLYLEDVDLGWRLRLMGLRSVQVPNARVSHDYEFNRHARKMFYLERNRLRMVWANYQPATLLLLAPALIMVEFAVLAAAVRHNWLDQKLQSYWGFWRLRSMLRQEHIRSRSIRTVGDGAILATMDAAFDGINQFEIHPLVRSLNRVATWYLGVVRRLVR
jgi:GT2 family glycosyltransferase